ncbi:MAG TPA: hypothetical protein VLL97_14245 [Acidobacteriota bacterium]|nr:hypothetical protein [Acidobacteriota bacterium]
MPDEVNESVSIFRCNPMKLIKVCSGHYKKSIQSIPADYSEATARKPVYKFKNNTCTNHVKIYQENGRQSLYFTYISNGVDARIIGGACADQGKRMS